MPTPFERLPEIEDPDDTVDRAYSSASRIAETETGKDSQEAMVAKALGKISGTLDRYVDEYPSFDRIDPFYREIAAAAVDVDEVRKSLARVDWASDKVREVRDEAVSEINAADGTGDAISSRKRAFARASSVLDRIEDGLTTLREAREVLVEVPEFRDLPTVVLAGYPNVGKSSLLRKMTRAKPELADYPFTTQSLKLGHMEPSEGYGVIQVVDTPGLLDRPESERNEMESQAVKALEHKAELVIFVYDPSEYCGYERERQIELYDQMEQEFDVDVVLTVNKIDLLDDANLDLNPEAESGLPDEAEAMDAERDPYTELDTELNIEDRFDGAVDVVYTSAEEDTGVDVLIAALTDRLGERSDIHDP
ncbi:MAG: NOG1 family protein [Halobacteria archaeon]